MFSQKPLCRQVQFLFAAWAVFFFVLPSVRAADNRPLRIGVAVQPISAPLFIADESGLFEKNSVEVQLVPFETGRESLEALLAGELDVAAVAETPIVLKSLSGARFKIIATVGSTVSSLALVGRKDLGITNTAQIRGKRLGVPKGTNAEYFYELLRIINRIPEQEVKVTHIPPNELSEALAEGKVDAIVGWEPFTDFTRQRIGDKEFVDKGSGIYRFCWNLVTTRELIAARSNDLQRVIVSLRDSCRAVRANPGEAAEKLAAVIKVPTNVLRASLEQCEFSPSLRQDLIVQLEGQARWFIRRDGGTNALPNYLEFIDTSILKSALPGHPTLIE